MLEIFNNFTHSKLSTSEYAYQSVLELAANERLAGRTDSALVCLDCALLIAGQIQTMRLAILHNAFGIVCLIG